MRAHWKPLSILAVSAMHILVAPAAEACHLCTRPSSAPTSNCYPTTYYTPQYVYIPWSHAASPTVQHETQTPSNKSHEPTRPSLDHTVASLQSGLKSLRDDVKSLSDDVKSLHNDVKSLNDDVKSLHNDVKSLHADLQSTKAQLKKHIGSHADSKPDQAAKDEKPPG
jgi:hypothetical protein